MARRRKTVTYRPNKIQGIFGTIWGGVFVLIGLFVVIPMAGPFGLLWTAAAAAITGMNAYQAFGKKYLGPEIHIEEEDGENFSHQDRRVDPEGRTNASCATLDAKERLEQLEKLKEAGLITQSEYREKREEILKEL